MNTAETIDSIRELRIKATEAIEDYMDEWIWNGGHDTVSDLGEGSHWVGLVEATIDNWHGTGEYAIGMRDGKTFQSTIFTCGEPESLAESLYLALSALHAVTRDDVDPGRNFVFVNKLSSK